MLRQEWKKLFSNKILLVVTAAVIIIPAIYTTLFLGSMWDPYGNVGKLPVAVVNHDRPAVLDGRALHIGKGMIPWIFVSRQRKMRKKGLRLADIIWSSPYRKTFQKTRLR